jgi:hypothetical protein
MGSLAHPDARYRGLGFKIGRVFPADDPLARWATVLAMAANHSIYLNVRLIEGDLPPELNLYYFRLVAAHFFEASDWLRRTPETWPEVREFIASLEEEQQAQYGRLTAFSKQNHPLHHALRRSRVTLFHYPEMHPGREQAGQEELANALEKAAELDGWIEGGQEYASFRASFADEVSLQFLGEEQDALEAVMMALREPVFELVVFAEAVLLEQLKRSDPLDVVVWSEHEDRPAIP